MDRFTENLAEGLRRFAMAGVGAVALTVDKSKEIIDKLAERGEASAADGRFACEDLQKKMAEQLAAFTQKLKADYEASSFEQLTARCMKLSPEQKAQLIDLLTREPEPESEPEQADGEPADDAPADKPCAEAGVGLPAEEAKEETVSDEESEETDGISAETASEEESAGPESDSADAG